MRTLHYRAIASRLIDVGSQRDLLRDYADNLAQSAEFPPCMEMRRPSAIGAVVTNVPSMGAV